ncbi:hypothetical protein Ahy_B06g082392 [Arachis hypogaea]|uniref:Uncharacterized protein n=1 Tax=Arachis hypogaea TaxID=3818 RepID=A0A444YNI2_ARAHY|nr:hypothetical protein Ahy_B06g082392 [Arachis hypogaea]
MVTISDKETEEELNRTSEQSEDSSAEKQEENPQETTITQKELLRLYAPFPQLLNGGVEKRIYSRFLDIFASLHVNIPFIKALQQMPSYIKYMKELLTRKSSLKGGQTIVMNKECDAHKLVMLRFRKLHDRQNSFRQVHRLSSSKTHNRVRSNPTRIG